MKIKPLADSVDIKLVEEEETTNGGLNLSDSPKEPRRQCGSIVRLDELQGWR